MNRFLASLQITFRRDPTNFRPRVNKLNSIKDREQKGESSVQLSSQCVFDEVFSGGQLFLHGGMKAMLACEVHTCKAFEGLHNR